MWVIRNGALASPQLLQVYPNSKYDPDKDEIALEVKKEVSAVRVGPFWLQSMESEPKGDFSHYVTVRKQLEKLRNICRESRNLAMSLRDRPRALRFTGTSHIVQRFHTIALAGSNDVFYLEYLPYRLFSSGCGLAVIPNCPQLANVRQVAVRFCHEWKDPNAVMPCPECGIIHRNSYEHKYPRHLYHFLARCLPNLEQFWFIDYFMQPKHHSESGLQSFTCRGRIYHEATPDNWPMKPKVLGVIYWLQDRFVQYSKASQHCHHKSPEKVKFGVLGCVHHVQAPRPPKASATSAKHKQIRKTPNRQSPAALTFEAKHTVSAERLDAQRFGNVVLQIKALDNVDRDSVTSVPGAVRTVRPPLKFAMVFGAQSKLMDDYVFTFRVTSWQRQEAANHSHSGGR